MKLPRNKYGYPKVQPLIQYTKEFGDILAKEAQKNLNYALRAIQEPHREEALELLDYYACYHVEDQFTYIYIKAYLFEENRKHQLWSIDRGFESWESVVECLKSHLRRNRSALNDKYRTSVSGSTKTGERS